jgi:Flp pilus assembly secretin CpaC
MAIDPLTPPSVATPQASPLSPLSPNVGPFEVVDNSNELVVVLGRSKHLRTKVDVEGAEAADRSVCDVQLTTARDLTIAGRNPGVSRVVVRLEGDSARPVVLLVRVVPDVAWQAASPRPADVPAREPSVVQAPPPPAPPPEMLGLRVIVAELDRTAAKAAGIDTDSTSSPATMLLQSLPRAGGNATVLKNRLTVCLGTRGLQEHGALRIFSEPTLSVVSGKPAKVVVASQPPAPPMPSSGGSHPHANDIPARPTTLNLVATLLTKDRIRLELTAEAQPQEPDAGLAPMGPSGPRAASAELGNGQTVVVCGLIDAPRKPPTETPEKFPIFGQFFSKPPPPAPHLTEMLILITAERLDSANAMSLGSPSAASSNAAAK